MHAPADQRIEFHVHDGWNALATAATARIVFGCTRTFFALVVLRRDKDVFGKFEAHTFAKATFDIPLGAHPAEGDLIVEVHYCSEDPIFLSSGPGGPPLTLTIAALFDKRLEEIKRLEKAAKVGRRSSRGSRAITRGDKLRFFYTLDRETMPGMVAVHCQTESVILSNFAVHLTGRTRMRSLFAKAGLHLQRDTEMEERQIEGALVAHRRMKPAFDCLDPQWTRDRVILEPSDAHQAAVADCFESFVDGELELKIPWNEATDGRDPVPGAPDGAFFLSFAEFVFYLNDHSRQGNNAEIATARKYWVKFARTFTMCAEAFVQLYWSGGPRRRDAYRNKHRGGHALGKERWQLLRAAYKEHEEQGRLERTFSALCAHALRDQQPDTLNNLHVYGPVSDNQRL